MARCKVNPGFRKELTAAVKVYEGAKGKSWTPQAVCAQTHQGYKVVRELLFMSSAEMQKLLGVGPQEIGLSPDTIVDEAGKSVDGLLLANPSQPFRRVEVFGMYATELSERVAAEDRQLRPDQGKETFEYFCEEAGKARPKAMRSQGLFTYNMVQEKVKAFQEKRTAEDSLKVPLAEREGQAGGAEQLDVAPLANLQLQKKEEEVEEETESDEKDFLKAVPGKPNKKQAKKMLASKKDSASRSRRGSKASVAGLWARMHDTLCLATAACPATLNRPQSASSVHAHFVKLLCQVFCAR